MPALQSMPASVELEGLIVGHGGNISAAQRSLAAIIELMRLPDQRFGGVFGLLCLGYGLCTQVQLTSSQVRVHFRPSKGSDQFQFVEHCAAAAVVEPYS